MPTSTAPILTYLDHAFLGAQHQYAPSADLRFAPNSPLGYLRRGVSHAQNGLATHLDPESVFHEAERFYLDFPDRYTDTPDDARAYKFKFDATQTPDGSVRRGRLKFYGVPSLSGSRTQLAADIDLWINQAKLEFVTADATLLYGGFQMVTPHDLACRIFGQPETRDGFDRVLRELLAETLPAHIDDVEAERDAQRTIVSYQGQFLEAIELPVGGNRTSYFFLRTSIDAGGRFHPAIGPNSARLLAALRDRQSEVAMYEDALERGLL